MLDIILFEEKKWNGKLYEPNNKNIYELKNGNGFIREYFPDGKLLFEGEYINGEKNGKGKEYQNDELMFDGEYLNGKKYNGNIKEYYYDGKLFFHGDLLKGRKWNGKLYEPNNNKFYEIENGKGFIKEFNYFGELEFEGEYLNGQRNGKGKEYGLWDHLMSEVEYVNGEKIVNIK